MTDGPRPVKGDEEHLAILAERAAGLVVHGRRALIGIAGAPGAGKTTFTEQLLALLRRTCPEGWVAHVPMDGFHLADAQLARLGALDRKGAPDTFDALGYARLLRRARHELDAPVYAPGFERSLEQPLAAALVVLPEARLVVTEGNYLLLDDGHWPVARAELDETWYVTTDQALRLSRLVDRHIRFGKTPAEAHDWVVRSDEANARLVAASVERADRVVLNHEDGWRPAS